MSEFVLLFASLFSIVNPFSTIPTFVSLTAAIEPRARRWMITQTTIAVFLILTVSYLAGEALLGFFSISVPSLRIAGGMVILAMGWSMVHARVSTAKQSPEEVEEVANRSAIAIVPMAMPLLAGPGSISLMIIVAGQATGVTSRLIALGAVLLVSVITWAILLAAGPIAKVLGRTGMNVATRFMGLILLATAVEFMTSGLTQIFPGWTTGG